MKKYSLYLVILLVFAGCEEEEPLSAGIQSRVYGHIMDIFDVNTPIENYKIKIGEYRRDFRFDGGAYDVFVKFIDSTTTDENGNFDLTFGTTGNGSNYKLHCEETDQVWTIYQDPIDIPNIGAENQVNLGFIHLYPVDLKITLSNLDYLPINIKAPLRPFSLENLSVNNLEQIRRIYVSKLEEDEVKFYRNLPDGTLQIATVTIPATNATTLTEYNINLTNADFN